MSTYSSGDTGSGDTGVNLEAHVTGNPIPQGAGGMVTVGHTWAIIVGALLLLWLFRTSIFRAVSM